MAIATSIFDSNSGLPLFFVSTSAISGARCSRSSAMRYNSCPRLRAGSSRHSFESRQARAACTAASISASPASATSASGSSVAGLVRQ